MLMTNITIILHMLMPNITITLHLLMTNITRDNHSTNGILMMVCFTIVPSLWSWRAYGALCWAKRILVSTSTANGVMSSTLLYSSSSVTSSTLTIFLLPARTMWHFGLSPAPTKTWFISILVLFQFARHVLHIENLGDILS